MSETTKKKAIIYCRVSSKEQADEGYSLEAQEKMLKEYVSKIGLEFSKIYKIAETASKFEVRKRFNEMLDFTKKHKVQTIVCEKIDRLTRNLKDAAIISDWVLDDGNRSVHFLKESFILSRNTKAHENLVWDMKVAIARFYTNNLSEEVKKGQIEKLEQGWMPKQAPLGYQTIGEIKHKTHIIDPAAAIYVKEIFDLYSTGLYSLHDLANHMYQRGLRSINGLKVSASNIRLVLGRTFYYGEITWNGKSYKGKHDPIISKELFDRCNIILHYGKPDKYIKHNPLFKGLVACASCQHKVSWYEKKGHWYGRCAQSNSCVQSKMPIREEFLVEQVFPFFEGLKMSESDIMTIKSNLQNDHLAEIEYRQTREKDFNRKIEIANSKMDIVYEDRLAGRITPDKCDIKLAELRQEVKNLTEARTRLQEDTIDYFDFGINLIELANKLKILWPDATKEEKQELFTLAFSEMKMTDKTLEITYTPWFAKLKNHMPNLEQVCELLKDTVNKEQTTALVALKDSWLGW